MRGKTDGSIKNSPRRAPDSPRRRCCSPPAEPVATRGSDAAGGAVRLTYVSYGGAGQDAQIKAFQEPYTAAHPNVTFVNTSPPDVAQVKAQVTTGAVQWDVVAVAPAAATQNCGTLFEKLDFPDLEGRGLRRQGDRRVLRRQLRQRESLRLPHRHVPGPGKAPKTIEDFFDAAKFPGKRGIITNLQNGILEYPLLADGVAPDKLYPLDVDRALKKWDTDPQGHHLRAERGRAAAGGQLRPGRHVPPVRLATDRAAEREGRTSRSSGT